MINRESGLKPRLTREFLDTLLEAGKICGWSVDYVEIKDFVRWCFEVADETIPTAAEFEPYEDDLEP